MLNNLVEETSKTAIDLADSDGVDEACANSSESIAGNDGLVLALKTRLKALGHINSVWLEDLDKEICVYIDASDTSKSTLRSIFGAQYDIEEEYPHLTFHFKVDSLELEKKIASKRLIRIV
jgi:hypothetical protein